MFCKNCGYEMSDNARFCRMCGSSNYKEEILQEGIKLQLKPVYKFTYSFLHNLNIGLILLVGVCACCVKFFWEFPRSFFVLAIIFFVFAVVKTILDREHYNNLEYNLYSTKLEYKDGYLSTVEKSLKYEYIREVVMSQSILENLCSVGTIKIYTNASAESGNGINMHCLENVEEKYKSIRQIIDECAMKN